MPAGDLTAKCVFQEVATTDAKLAACAQAKYKACVRTCLRLAKGYECQDLNGVFMLAFENATDAVCWAMLLNLALLQCVSLIYLPVPGTHDNAVDILQLLRVASTLCIPHGLPCFRMLHVCQRSTRVPMHDTLLNGRDILSQRCSATHNFTYTASLSRHP